MNLSDKKIILASNSPRRRELLAGLNIDFTVDTRNNFEEHFTQDMPHSEVPAMMSLGKSLGFHRPLEPDEILITSDTMVLCHGTRLSSPGTGRSGDTVSSGEAVSSAESGRSGDTLSSAESGLPASPERPDSPILGKPHSREEAFAMLRLLSGREHEVITAVTIRSCEKTITRSDTTEVIFKDLTDEEITYYIDNFKPFDKAGAYGIQEWIGYIGITGISGSYFNVMGFPTHLVYEMLQEF